MKNNKTPIGIAVALLVSTATSALAQNYSIDWFTIHGGGGTSTAGVYQVSGSIGQPDGSGPMTGGNFSLTGGFWSLLGVVPTPGAPKLTITLTGANMAVISWPSPSTGFVLQQNAALNSANWVVSPDVITDDGANRSIIVNPSAGNRFYRLAHP
ncbi:MAG TPA: hypothetical protein VFV34_10860 [Blastocatellia bacterium]|nr:hypothetical protein [Blastocatellia bacterium]